jgi:hypothetical protein
MECKPLSFLNGMKSLYREIAATVCRGRRRDDPLRLYLKWAKEEATAVSLIVAMTVDRKELRELSNRLYDTIARTARMLFILGLRGEIAAPVVVGFLRRCTEVQCSILRVFLTTNRQQRTVNHSPRKERNA